MLIVNSLLIKLIMLPSYIINSSLNFNHDRTVVQHCSDFIGHLKIFNHRHNLKWSYNKFPFRFTPMCVIAFSSFC